MYVDIDETWNNKQIINFDHGLILAGEKRGNGNNTAIRNGYVRRLKNTVQKYTAAGQQITHGIPPACTYSHTLTIYCSVINCTCQWRSLETEYIN
ncbi:hypothetical protein SDC9_132705 [bioreactor metagenome]|uniref:Uncharacterized protein n=1 Tax=bioreactor metagenome TaxID=1076179 RepID=A0A645D8F7_9ZZZZ